MPYTPPSFKILTIDKTSINNCPNICTLLSAYPSPINRVFIHNMNLYGFVGYIIHLSQWSNNSEKNAHLKKQNWTRCWHPTVHIHKYVCIHKSLVRICFRSTLIINATMRPIHTYAPASITCSRYTTSKKYKNIYGSNCRKTAEH